jgi:hypothetical protein
MPLFFGKNGCYDDSHCSIQPRFRGTFMPLKNYRSAMPIQRIFERLQHVLIKHGARQIMFEYDGAGNAIGMTFVVALPQRTMPIRLPARMEKVKRVLQQQGIRVDDEQIYRIAWRNILDWVEAQLALIETEMVRLEEVFLPYMATPSGQTYFDILQQRGFLLPNGDNRAV